MSQVYENEDCLLDKGNKCKKFPWCTERIKVFHTKSVKKVDKLTLAGDTDQQIVGHCEEVFELKDKTKTHFEGYRKKGFLTKNFFQARIPFYFFVNCWMRSEKKDVVD